MMDIDLKTSIQNFILYPKDPLCNFTLGKKYDDRGQTSSAISYYLRAAEFSEESLLAYECLLKISSCLEKQGNRNTSCKSSLLRAISVMPNRPEAYWQLSRIYEITREWHECYAISCVGESLKEENLEPLKTDVGYPGKEVFTFQRAVSAWWVGLYDESIHLFRKIISSASLPSNFIQASKNNLNNLAGTYKKLIKYEKPMYSDLRYKFPGAENIEKNYSQVYQDMFILSMLNGKKGGSYIEIGCCDPFFNSNTALLETGFGWNGISIDINPKEIEKYKGIRNTKTLLADATKIDYEKLLGNTVYDYLQVDCEPAITSFTILQRIPFYRVKFAVITFEHDKYIDENQEIQEKTKKYLESFGYVQVVNNVSEDNWSAFEDWYVHPDLVDNSIIKKMMYISDLSKRADKYFLGKI
ncbi:MAG: hypothetical protein GYA51_00110 [Candidatus Methanofastidiosa archaeon]|nr:hypothetical protein [Candidatus Methanofastidiosa archaeon]